MAVKKDETFFLEHIYESVTKDEPKEMHRVSSGDRWFREPWRKGSGGILLRLSSGQERLL